MVQKTEARAAGPAQVTQAILCPLTSLSQSLSFFPSPPLSLSPSLFVSLFKPLSRSLDSHLPSPNQACPTCFSHHTVPVSWPTCHLPQGVFRWLWLAGCSSLGAILAWPEPLAGSCQARPRLPLSQGNFREQLTRPTGLSLRSTPDRPYCLCLRLGHSGCRRVNVTPDRAPPQAGSGLGPEGGEQVGKEKNQQSTSQAQRTVKNRAQYR